MELGADSHYAGIKNVAETHEERVYDGLRLVLGLARSGKEERLADCVLERVVGGVLDRLAPLDQAEERDERDRRIRHERDHGENEKGSTDSDQREQPRHREGLQQEAEQIDIGEE